MVPFTPYQRKLFAFLSVACFFEGYDFFALTQILPNLRADMNLSEGPAGLLVTIINIGTVLAYGLVRLADRVGRKRILTTTIAGYTIFTLLSGFATGPVTFAVAQLLSRVFLIGEWAISMVFIAEEFPAARRGYVMGVVQMATSLGGIVCAGLVPLLIRLPWGWRSVYLTSIVPLVLVAAARRGIRETERFASQGPQPTTAAFHGLFHVLRTRHRTRVLQLGLVWSLTYMGIATAVTFWKDFAVHHRGFSDAQIGMSMPLAALGSMPLTPLAGRLIDAVGRKLGGVIVYAVSTAGIIGAYTLHGQWPLTLALVFAISGTGATLVVLNTLTTESFPTEVRADAFAWSNNLLGRIGYVLSPVLVGYGAESVGLGLAVSVSALLPLLGIAFAWWQVPETRGADADAGADRG